MILIVEATDGSDDGVLLCDHGHIYQIDDPDDKRELLAALGPSFLGQLHA